MSTRVLLVKQEYPCRVDWTPQQRKQLQSLHQRLLRRQALSVKRQQSFQVRQARQNPPHSPSLPSQN
jgi:hypothetical protein